MMRMGPRRGLSRRLSGVISSSAVANQEASSKRDEVVQIALHAARPHQHQAAGHIGQRGQQAEQDGELDHELLSAMPNMKHVAVLHEVLLAFQPQCALRARSRFRACREQSIPANRLCANEVMLEVRVDGARGLRRF